MLAPLAPMPELVKSCSHTGCTAALLHNSLPCIALQGRALSELRQLEETSASLSSSIQEALLAKRQLLDDLIEAERQIMLSERKIQLEKEMQVCVDRLVWWKDVTRHAL